MSRWSMPVALQSCRSDLDLGFRYYLRKAIVLMWNLPRLTIDTGVVMASLRLHAAYNGFSVQCII